MVNELKGQKVIGIKRTPSKDGKKIYTTYYMLRPWTDYELDAAVKNSDPTKLPALEGNAVEEINTTEDFPIQIGDVVKFFYGKAVQYGDKVFQPVDDFKLIESSVYKDKSSGK